MAGNIVKKIAVLSKKDFLAVWKESNREEAFKLCNEIREKIGVPLYDRKKFEEGYSYRTIFVEDYGEALDEFVNLVFGWW